MEATKASNCSGLLIRFSVNFCSPGHLSSGSKRSIAPNSTFLIRASKESAGLHLLGTEGQFHDTLRENMDMESNGRVEHRIGESRFVYQDDPRCEVVYRQTGKVVDFVRTYVPNDLRGKGIAQALAHEALLWAKENHLEVVATCSFVGRYIDQHQEFQNLRRSSGSRD